MIFRVRDFQELATFMAATCALLAIAFSTAHAQQAVSNVKTNDVFPFDKDNVASDVTAKTVDSEAKQDPSPSPSASLETTQSESPRRAQPAPFDGVFPGTEYLGPVIGVTDTDPVWPLTKALWDTSPGLKRARIKAYGWFNPGFTVSTSNNSNQPLSYAIVPNKLEMDQAVLRFERVPDTAQTDHVARLLYKLFMNSLRRFYELRASYKTHELTQSLKNGVSAHTAVGTLIIGSGARGSHVSG